MVTIPDIKVNSTKEIIDNVDIQIIYIPLESNLNYKYLPTVKVGEHVYIGSIVGKSNIVDTPLLSSVSGTVVGYQNKYIACGKQVKCLVIENDFKEKYVDKVGKKDDITKYSKKEFVNLLESSAILGMGGSGFPTYIKYDIDAKINYLIVNGAECDVYVSSDGSLMYDRTEEILEGIDAIMDIMNIDKCYIAINEKNEIIINKFLRHINTYPNIKIYPLLDGYPNGYEKYLVETIIGVKYDKLPIEVGVICDNVATIYAIYESLKFHKPLIDRIVTIAGDGIKKAVNYKLKIGTNFNELLLKTNILKKIDNPIIVAGGAMMGRCILSDDLIVTADLGCILVLQDVNEKALPCIKCGKCTEVCPMNLIPSAIIERKQNIKELHIDKCINCGLCSYICPSKIEVREKIIKIKGEYNG